MESSSAGSSTPLSATSPKSKMTKREKAAVVREELVTLHSLEDPGVPRICIDLSFGHLMSKKEMTSLASQIRQVYGSNRRAAQPFQVWLTSLEAEGSIYKALINKNCGFLDYVMNKTDQHFSSVFAMEDVIYLTPDSTNVLSDLESDKVYVIGGLVDGTVLPSTTYDLAKAEGIQTARLPIKTVLKPGEKGTFSPVLTINQVFDILLHYYTTKSWEEALVSGVPKRKGLTLR